MTSAPDGGDASGSTPRMRSFSSITATFVHTLSLPSMSFPNRRYCVAATAWDASASNASLRSVLLMDRVSVQGPGLVVLTQRGCTCLYGGRGDWEWMIG